MPRGGRRGHPPARAQRRRLQHAVDRALRARSSTRSGASATASSSRRPAAPSACRSTSAPARSPASPRWPRSTAASINFGDDVFVNSRPDIRDLAARIRAAGAVAELECYEVGHVEEALALAAEGAIAAPLHFQFVLGVKGAIGAREEVMGWMRSLLPAGATWGVAAVGRSQRPMTELAMRLGGHARVGLEDNIYLAKGVLSPRAARRSSRALRPTPARSGASRPTRPAPARSWGSTALPTRRARASAKGSSMVATFTFVADTITPVRAYAALRRAAGERRVVPARERRRGRALGALLDPRLSPAPRDDSARERAVGRRRRRAGEGARRGDGSARGGARDVRARAEPRRRNPAARFAQTYVGYLAWDLVHSIEKVPGWGPRRDRAARLASSAGPRSSSSTACRTRSRSRPTTRRTSSERASTSKTRRRSPPLALPDRARLPRGRHGQRGRRDVRGQGAARAGVHRRGRRVPDRRGADVPRPARDGATRSTSTARCACSTRARTCTSSICRRRRASATRTQIAGASPETMVHLESRTDDACGRSPGRRAARQDAPRRTRRSSASCWPIRRSAPST